jgi:segregation and condensation protein B
LSVIDESNRYGGDEGSADGDTERAAEPAGRSTAGTATEDTPLAGTLPAGTVPELADPPAGPNSPTELRGALEAILLVVDEPVEPVTLAQVLATPIPQILDELHSLRAQYEADERGYELREIAGGWRLYTRAAFARFVERFVLDGQHARLTQAALETLAVVAYRQPVSRVRVSAVRGVNVDGVMRTLISRGLVEEAGSDHDSGALLYRTSPYFLERLGLRTLEDLPPLANILPEAMSIDQLEDELSSEGRDVRG